MFLILEIPDYTIVMLLKAVALGAAIFISQEEIVPSHHLYNTDRVWHEGLLFKLKQLGISGTLLKWLESYVALRKQRVILDGCCSDVSYVEAGVPQGCILGPLLFLV